MLKKSKIGDQTATGQTESGVVGLPPKRQGKKFRSKVPGVMITQWVDNLPEEMTTPDFTRKPIGLTIQEAKLAVFKAKVIGNPEPKVTWSRANGVLDDPEKYQVKFDPTTEEHTLEIPKVTAEEADTYKCFATNEYGKAVCTVVLNIIEVGFKKKKEMAQADGSPSKDPTEFRKMLRKGKKMEGKKDGEPDEAVWELLLSADKKDYERICLEFGITDFRKMLKKLQQLKVEREVEQAQFIEHLSNLKHISVKNENSATFELEMDLKDPNSRIFLFKDGVMVEFSKEDIESLDQRHNLKQTGKKYVFTIRNLSPEDAGLYSVDVEGVNVFSTDFKIPPVDFAVKIKEVKAEEREDALFECVITQPMAEIVWTLKSVPVVKSEKFEITVSEDKLIHRLKIVDCQLLDAGIYAAVAGIKSCNAWLVVEADKDPAKKGKKKARKTTQAGGNNEADLAKIVAEQKENLKKDMEVAKENAKKLQAEREAADAARLAKANAAAAEARKRARAKAEAEAAEAVAKAEAEAAETVAKAAAEAAAKAAADAKAKGLSEKEAAAAAAKAAAEATAKAKEEAIKLAVDRVKRDAKKAQAAAAAAATTTLAAGEAAGEAAYAAAFAEAKARGLSDEEAKAAAAKAAVTAAYDAAFAEAKAKGLSDEEARAAAAQETAAAEYESAFAAAKERGLSDEDSRGFGRKAAAADAYGAAFAAAKAMGLSDEEARAFAAKAAAAAAYALAFADAKARGLSDEEARAFAEAAAKAAAAEAANASAFVEAKAKGLSDEEAKALADAAAKAVGAAAVYAIAFAEAKAKGLSAEEAKALAEPAAKVAAYDAALAEAKAKGLSEEEAKAAAEAGATKAAAAVVAGGGAKTEGGAGAKKRVRAGPLVAETVIDPGVYFATGLGNCNAIVGESAELVCKLSSESCEGTWSKDGEELASTEGVTISKEGAVHKLKIHKVSDQHAGKYRFDADGRKTESMIVVEDPPRFGAADLKAFAAPVVIKTNGKAAFKIPFVGREPLKIQWYKKGEELSSDTHCHIEHSEGCSRMFLSKLIRKDTGEIKMKLKNEFGTVEAFAQLTVLDKPTPPIGPLEIIEASANSIEIKWKPPKDDGGCPVTNYIMERQQVGRNTWKKIGQVSADAHYKDTDVDHGRRYCYRIKAVTSEGISELMETEDVQAGTKAYPGPPSAPKVISAFKDCITLAWTPPTNTGGTNILGYNLEKRKKGSNLWGLVNPPEEPITAKTYEAKDVIEGMEYEFRVSAINTSGAGEPSTPSEFVFARDPKKPPGKVLDLKVTDSTYSTLSLGWTQPKEVAGVQDEVKGYFVEIRPAEETEWERCNSNYIIMNSFTVRGMKSMAMYWVRVIATNNGGEGLPQELDNYILAMPPPVRPRFTDAKIESFMVVIAGNSARFNINFQASPSPEITWLKDGVPVSKRVTVSNAEATSQILIPSAERPDTGVYTIVVKNVVGQVTYSIEIRVTDEPKPPGPVELDQNVPGTVTVSWTPSPDEKRDDRLYYLVTKRDSSKMVWHPIAGHIFNNKFTATNILPGREYQFRVYAKNDMGSSKPSESTKWLISAKKEKFSLNIPESKTCSLERPPKFLVPLKLHSAPQGYECYMSCAVKGDPAPHVTWYRNNLSLNTNTNYHITNTCGVCSMLILTVGPKDTGEYKIIAENPLGRVECSTQLTVRE